MEINIVFIHKGNSWYIPYALHQAAFSNPSANIAFIGDQVKSSWDRNISIKDFESVDSANFSQIYQHRSNNCRGFETFCWLRWFYLRDYMRRNSLNHAWYFDTDVLVYGSLKTTQSRFKSGEYKCGFLIPEQELSTFTWAASGHSSYWEIGALESFCEFILLSFASKKYIALYNSKYEYYLSANKTGGVCDMTSLYLFWEEYPNIVLNLSQVYKSSVFDLGIASSDGFYSKEYVVKGGIKSLSFDRGIPILYRFAESRETVEALTLHFQGAAKQHIPSFYRGDRFRGKALHDLRNSLRVLKSVGSGYLCGTAS